MPPGTNFNYCRIRIVLKGSHEVTRTVGLRMNFKLENYFSYLIKMKSIGIAIIIEKSKHFYNVLSQILLELLFLQQI